MFKGRYKAIVVQEGSYLLQLVRYIHMNPVKAGIVKKIKDFKNSSHTQFLQKEESTWLKYLEVLQKQFSVDGRSDFYASYCSFMNKGDDEITTILEEKSRKAAAAIILGDDRFIDEVKKNYLHKKRVVAEIPQAKQIHNEIMIKKIKKEVINEYGKNNASLYTSTRGKENISRMMAIGLARECSGYPYEKIAEIFGGIQYKSAAKYYERLKDKCKSDSKIKKVFGNLKQRCSQVET